MKEHPILFNAQMVRAILSGKKTQTRRLVPIQPPSPSYQLWRCMSTTGSRRDEGKLHWMLPLDTLCSKADDTQPYFPIPYQIGDVLWVRETTKLRGIRRGRNGYIDDIQIEYAADGEMVSSSSFPATGDIRPYKRARIGKCTPSIHMPRWASRINLTVTDVDVQRVRDITEEEAIAEGCWFDGQYYLGGPHPVKGSRKVFPTARQAFKDLWDSLYAAKNLGWDANPWVWVYTFERM